MGTKTRIAWTDFSWNSWWGCLRVSPACDACYAAVLDRRTGGSYWDGTKIPRRTMEANWAIPQKMNKKAVASGRPLRCFLGSMMDWADNRVPEQWRVDMWGVVRENTALRFQMLSKRAPNIARMLPEDWGVDGYPHVWLGVTVEDRKHGVPRIDHLRKVPARVRFLSVEPLLEDLGELDLSGIHWVIIGGESGPRHRPIKREWVDNVIAQCRSQDVAVFFKQWGGRTPEAGGCELDGVEIKEFPRAA